MEQACGLSMSLHVGFALITRQLLFRRMWETPVASRPVVEVAGGRRHGCGSGAGGFAHRQIQQR